MAKTTSTSTSSQVTENILTKARLHMPMDVSQGFQPPDVDKLRIVVTGRPGCGKSSFVASNPRALLFDLEGAAGSVPCARAIRAEVRATSRSPADDIRASVKALVATYRTSAELRSTITTVAFDSFDALVEMFSRDLKKKHDLEDVGDYGTGHGKGYFVIRDEIFEMLESLRQVGLGFVLVSHLSMKEVEEGTLVPVLNVSGTFRNNLVRCRDLQFRMDCVPATEEVKTKTGVTITRTVPGKRKFILATDTTPASKDFDGPKCTVPIKSGLEIPAIDGWEAFRKAYATAVELRRSRKEVL